jgi:hypothetical protein
MRALPGSDPVGAVAMGRAMLAGQAVRTVARAMALGLPVDAIW